MKRPDLNKKEQLAERIKAAVERFEAARLKGKRRHCRCGGSCKKQADCHCMACLSKQKGQK